MTELTELAEEPGGPLHTPRHDIQTPTSCGPIAMAAVTGEPISVIHNAIYRASNYKVNPANGITDRICLAAMELLGWSVFEVGWTAVEEWNGYGEGYTLDAFAEAHGSRGPFIVMLTKHCVAISGGEFCDTSMELPCDLFEALDQSGWRCNRIGSTWVHNWYRFENWRRFELDHLCHTVTPRKSRARRGQGEF
jgi:hypothetical protein